MALNVLFANGIEVGDKGKKVILADIKQSYISKSNSIFESQVILLMITHGVNKWC